MGIKFTNIFLYYIDSPKFTQTGIFGLKIYHLATLEEEEKKRFAFRKRFHVRLRPPPRGRRWCCCLPELAAKCEQFF
jgi:hypothetical protein